MCVCALFDVTNLNMQKHPVSLGRSVIEEVKEAVARAGAPYTACRVRVNGGSYGRLLAQKME